jgi:GNAT superfamily N-acetyltransferase
MRVIRHMSADDFPQAMRLKEQAGWNQTETDWRRALSLEPEGCFSAELDGSLVGTTTTCIFGPIAWVAMVLVDDSVRRRGIGTALMRHALEFLDRRGVRTVRLDATGMGQPLYAKLGFKVQYKLTRYVGTFLRVRPDEEAGGAETLSRDQLESVLEYDRAVTATDRRKLLTQLFDEHPRGLRGVWRGGKLAGFLMSRSRLRGVQVGPCLADPEAGTLLLQDACRRHVGQEVFIDIPPGNPDAAGVAQSMGLTSQRRLVRMCRGEMVTENQEHIWASFGPEKG